MTPTPLAAAHPATWDPLDPQVRPDPQGRFGPFGGRFVPETLMSALTELEEAFEQHWRDPDFRAEFHSLLRDFVGRPSPLYFACLLYTSPSPRDS
mgnify:CR=1 FL=1